MGMVTLKYAKEVMQAVSQAEGRLMFCILRAPVREVRTTSQMIGSRPIKIVSLVDKRFSLTETPVQITACKCYSAHA